MGGGEAAQAVLSCPPSQAWEDLSTQDRSALTEMLVDKIVIEPAPERDRGCSGRQTQAATQSARSRTKILCKRLRGSRRCTTPGSRSSQGSERVVHRAATW